MKRSTKRGMNKKGGRQIKTMFFCMLLFLMTLSGTTAYGASQPKQIPVIFHKKDGAVIKTSYVSNGKLRLPDMKNPKGYTFLGWSKKKGQEKAPQYQAGESITVTKKLHLYEVKYDRRKEKCVSGSEFTKIDTGKYSKVIFIGDSRTTMLKTDLEAALGQSQWSRLSFVCQNGQGLSWFRKTGEAQVRKEITNARKAYPGKKVAVIFNLGVNDIRHRNGTDPDCDRVAAAYVSYMNKLGNDLTKKGAKCFYMSVNPVNTTMSVTPGLRRPQELLKLNRLLKSGLNRSFTWINTHDWLVKNGYSTNRSRCQQTLIDDGVHYSWMTGRRIYKYCIEKINTTK